MVDWNAVSDRLTEVLTKAIGGLFRFIVYIALMILLLLAVIYVAEWISQPPGPCDFWKAPIGRKAC
jgi:hypothetical protein